MAKTIDELVHPSWVPALGPLQPLLTQIGEFLRTETAAGRPWAPGGSRILRAFEQPLDDVRVLIVGQDPYPTPGHAVGSPSPWPLTCDRCRAACRTSSASCTTTSRPDSEQRRPHPVDGAGRDAAQPGAHHAPWRARQPSGNRLGGVHGAAAIAALVERLDAPLVAILWGRDAQSLEPDLPDVPVIASAHPSPMSADRGFFGSRPFSRANALLDELGAEGVDWRLP